MINEETNVSKGTETIGSMVSESTAGIKSSHFHGMLPTGYLDEDGKIHQAIDIRPYTGAEEDILASTKMPMYRRIGKILEACILRIGEIEDKNKLRNVIRSLVNSDRLWATVQLRIATNGENYQIEVECPEEDCKKRDIQTVNLKEVKWEGIKEPHKRQYMFTLPGSGKKVSWNVLDGTREEKANIFSYDKDLLSIGIYSRVNDIDGKQVTMEMIKAMSPGDRRALRAEFSKYEGKIDDEIEFECQHCGNIFKGTVDYGQASFFFPTDEVKS